MNVSLLDDLGLEKVELEPESELLREGERGARVYVLLSGKVKITSKGHELSQVETPGTILGEISALLGTNNVATVTTVEPTKFYIIENFTEFVKGHPDLCLSVAQVLAIRVINMNNHLVFVKDQLDNLRSSLANYLPVFPEDPEVPS